MTSRRAPWRCPSCERRRIVRHLRVEADGGLRIRGLGLDLSVDVVSRSGSHRATLSVVGRRIGASGRTTLEAACQLRDELEHALAGGVLDLLSDVAEMCPAATVSEVLPFVRASHALCETNHTAKSENKGDFHPDAVDPPRDPDRTPAEVMDPQ